MKRRIAVLDAETDPFEAGEVPAPFVWGYYDGDTYRQWWNDTPGLVGFLEDQDVICFAHNGGKFDWHYLLEYLTPFDNVMLINGRIAKMKIGRCECRDSINIIPVPLAKFKKDKFDYSLMHKTRRDKPANRALIERYLRHDCEYLYELIARFIEDYGLKLTQAGAAMEQWRKIGGDAIPRTDKDFYDAMSKFYYGGRVQCFRSGIINTRFQVYDINSAYPEAMLHEHPYSEGFSHVKGYQRGADFYSVECESLGAFPYRDEAEGLCFPADGQRRCFHVTAWEVEAAKQTGTLKKARWIESVKFDASVNFRAYIEHFWNTRRAAQMAGDKAGDIFCKLLMNSLYGKFAANPGGYREHMIVPMEVIGGLEGLGWQFAGEFGPWGLAEAPLAEERQRFYNVATGASITGYVRAKLWRAICGARGMLYCDTDSIACERAGDDLALSDQLGDWKCEGEFDRAGIGGKKLYIFRGVADAAGKRQYKTASKGARLNNRQLWRVAQGGEVLYKPEVPTYSHVKAPYFQTRLIRKTA